MRKANVWMVMGGIVAASTMVALAQGGQGTTTPPPAEDPVRALVAQLDLEKYKATIKGLTQFGDRRQGTKRNRDAVDWIEAQLKAYGCQDVQRVIYQYPSPEASDPAAAARQGGAAQGARPGGANAAGAGAQGAGAARQGGAQGQGAVAPGGQRAGGGGGRGAALGPLPEPSRGREGGATLYGNRGRTGVNSDPMAQPDEKLRALNSEPTTPGERQEVFCTKIGTTHPDEAYIISGHMDGHGWGEAANDDGSGTAIVMELARILNQPNVQTERSIRFAIWNNEETGLNGAWAYVNQRKALQGVENPKGSRKFPEPKWLGVIQHDMMLWDHGMPDENGVVSKEQRREADFNIEFQVNSTMADQSMKLALAVKLAADKYSTDYPGTMGPHMTNTDSTPFMNTVPAISMRENERGMHTGAGWNPTWHQPIDVFSTFSDKDFKLGLNAAQATLGAVGQLVGATVKK